MIDEDPDFGDLQRCEEVAAINAFWTGFWQWRKL